MQGSRALRSGVVAISILAAFLVGRSSVRPSGPGETLEISRVEPPQKLSAITPADSELPRRSASRDASADTRLTDPPMASQIDDDLRTVAEFLSAAASKSGDLRDLAETISAWIDHDPDEAIDWLATGHRRDEILTMMFQVWGHNDPSAALSWLETNRETNRYEHAATGLASTLDSEEALKLAETLSDPSSRAMVWTEAGAELYAHDQEASLERLAAADFPDELERLMVKSWKQRLSNKSKRNAQNLASVFSSAVAAGANFEGQSSDEIARELVAGITGADSYSTTKFQVPKMSEAEIAHAIENLEFVGQNQLNYAPTPDEDL